MLYVARVAVCCSVLQILSLTPMQTCSVSQCVAVCRSVLLCVAVLGKNAALRNGTLNKFPDAF